MSRIEDMGYDCYDMEDIPGTDERKELMYKKRIGIHKYLQDGYVKSIEYCKNCGSVNVKLSEKGNKYCGQICWLKVKEDYNQLKNNISEDT